MTAALTLLVAVVAVRNPFWPIGYEGTKETISSEPKVELSKTDTTEVDDTATAGAVAQATVQAELAAQKISSHNWAEARKTLRISGTTTVTDAQGRKRYGAIINGLTYGDGDLISINHKGHRFTWRVQGLTEGATLRLVRLRVKEIDDDPKGDKK